MSAQLLDPTTLTPEQLVALVKADLLVLPTDGNGQAPAPAPEAKADVSEEWVNVAGYVCTGQFPAYISSLNIVKHLNGTCKCADDKPEKCPAHERYGYTAEEFGSDLDVVVPAHLFKDYVPA